MVFGQAVRLVAVGDLHPVIISPRRAGWSRCFSRFRRDPVVAGVVAASLLSAALAA
jgi:hypothetical protein